MHVPASRVFLRVCAQTHALGLHGARAGACGPQVANLQSHVRAHRAGGHGALRAALSRGPERALSLYRAPGALETVCGVAQTYFWCSLAVYASRQGGRKNGRMEPGSASKIVGFVRCRVLNSALSALRAPAVRVPRLVFQ